MARVMMSSRSFSSIGDQTGMIHSSESDLKTLLVFLIKTENYRDNKDHNLFKQINPVKDTKKIFIIISMVQVKKEGLINKMKKYNIEDRENRSK